MHNHMCPGLGALESPSQMWAKAVIQFQKRQMRSLTEPRVQENHLSSLVTIQVDLWHPVLGSHFKNGRPHRKGEQENGCQPLYGQQSCSFSSLEPSISCISGGVYVHAVFGNLNEHQLHRWTGMRAEGLPVRPFFSRITVSPKTRPIPEMRPTMFLLLCPI